jgi:hypothetical protein
MVSEDHFTWPERQRGVPYLLVRSTLGNAINDCNDPTTVVGSGFVWLFRLTLVWLLARNSMQVAEIQPSCSSSSHGIQPYEMARVTRPMFLCLQNSAHSCSYILHLLPFEAQQNLNYSNPVLLHTLHFPGHIRSVLVKFGGWSISSIPFPERSIAVRKSRIFLKPAAEIYCSTLMYQKYWKAFDFLRWRFASKSVVPNAKLNQKRLLLIDE